MSAPIDIEVTTHNGGIGAFETCQFLDRCLSDHGHGASSVVNIYNEA
jgi:hypothetical protein